MRQLTLFPLIAVLSIPQCLAAQNLSIGLIGGAALTDAVQSQAPIPSRGASWSPHKDWIAGVAVEFGIVARLSLEVDGMYRELHASEAFVEPNGTLNSVSPVNVVTWEFPVLAKYRLSSGPWRPFVEAGPAFRSTGNLNFMPSHFGVSAGAGLETRWRGWNIAPVLRFTRWEKDPVPLLVKSQPDQLELLLAVSRASESRTSPLGQRVSVGAVVGWGLTKDLPSLALSTQFGILQGSTYTLVPATTTITGLNSPVAGAALQIGLSRRLSAGIDVLYKPLRQRFVTAVEGQAPPSFFYLQVGHVAVSGSRQVAFPHGRGTSLC
jgi:hypothetical protein